MGQAALAEEIPNSKSQIPVKFQASETKHALWILKIGSLALAWNLVFGIWNFQRLSRARFTCGWPEATLLAPQLSG
jgi:hypothetical protein